jgi:hypothetical protein
MKPDILTRLGFYLQEAIATAGEKQLSRVSQAIVPLLPDIVSELKNLAVSNETTPAQKLQAIEMILQCWSRCLKVGVKKQEYQMKRQRLKVKDRKSKLAISRKREEISKKLAQAAKEIGR